jgi:hypothetical protein
VAWFRRTSQAASASKLIAAIEEYMQQNNRQPRPFVWTASVEKILERINRCKVILETVQQNH